MNDRAIYYIYGEDTPKNFLLDIWELIKDGWNYQWYIGIFVTFFMILVLPFTIAKFLYLLIKLKQTKKQKMQAMKDAVLATAKLLAHPNNTFTTLEIKTKLIQDYPHFMWKQNDGPLSVSQIMIEYANSGIFVFTDNGTFRTYSDPTYVFPSQTITMSNIGTGTPCTTAACKKAYNTKLKKAIVLLAKKHRGRPTQAIMDARALVAHARKNALKKATAAVAPITSVVTIPIPTVNVKAKNPMHNVSSISRTEAATRIENAHGKFGCAEFIKKDGNERVINFKVIKDQVQSKLGYVKVLDMALYNHGRAQGLSKADSEKASMRQINLQTIKKLTLNGLTNKVR